MFSIWLKQYKSNRTKGYFLEGRCSIELKVVCIDLHAGPNEGHYGHLIVLRMHRGRPGEPSFSSVKDLLCSAAVAQVFQLLFALTSHIQIECSTTKGCLTQKT